MRGTTRRGFISSRAVEDRPKLRPDGAPQGVQLDQMVKGLEKLRGERINPDDLFADLRRWVKRDIRWNMFGEQGWVLKPNGRLQRKHLTVADRRAVIARFKRTCVYCRRTGTADRDAEGKTWALDHYVPKAKGGTCNSINLVLACRWCNNDKCDDLWVPGHRKNTPRPPLWQQARMFT